MYNYRVEPVLTVSEARSRLSAIVERVLAGEEVTLTRHGRPVAVVVRPDTLRARRAGPALATAASVEDALARGRSTPLSPRPTISERRAKALVADVRAARSGR